MRSTRDRQPQEHLLTQRQRNLGNMSEIIIFFGALALYVVAYVLWLKYAGR